MKMFDTGESPYDPGLLELARHTFAIRSINTELSGLGDLIPGEITRKPVVEYLEKMRDREIRAAVAHCKKMLVEMEGK